MLREQATHLPGRICAARIGMRTARTPAGPSMPRPSDPNVDKPLLPGGIHVCRPRDDHTGFRCLPRCDGSKRRRFSCWAMTCSPLRAWTVWSRSPWKAIVGMSLLLPRAWPVPLSVDLLHGDLALRCECPSAPSAVPGHAAILDPVGAAPHLPVGIGREKRRERTFGRAQ